MKVYRGPKSKPLYDDSHELVSTISPAQLEKGVKSGAWIQFNITKDGFERQAICTAKFDEADLVPMVNGLVSRLATQQGELAEVKKLLQLKSLTDEQKVARIKAALNWT